MTRFRPYRGYLTIVLLNMLALGFLVWQLRDPRSGAVRVVPAPLPTPAPTTTPVRLAIHVSGAVVRPGVVTLPEGARAGDAIGAAGGFSGDADQAGVNLAQPLSDGQQLHVPAEGETGRVLLAAPVAEAPDGSDGSSEAASPVVNVNRASAAELETLPGIGPALAARIVAHRSASGPFSSPDALLEVPGIGPKTLERFRARIAVR